MNKHFEDTRYYLKRAGATAMEGVAEGLEPIQTRVADLIGDDEPEMSRIDEVRNDLHELRERAEGETREAIEKAREKVDDYRAARKAA
jgi:hypothetical protein